MSSSKKTGKKKQQGTQQPTISTEALIKKAQESVDEFDFEKAHRLCALAVKQSPMNLEALELMGGILLELGQPNKAIERYRKCILLAPNTGYTKYLSMGQLHEGKKALEYFQKGLEILKAEKAQNPNEEQMYNRKISSALCSITDLYLTDLCYEEDAEQRCCALLDEAALVDPTNPEVFQMLASVRISQCKPEEAKEMMKKSTNLWLEKEQQRRARLEDAAENGEGLEGEEEEEESLAPSYDFRINTAKILVELEMYEIAAQVLEMLLTEDDEVVEVWYLLGYVYVLMKERKSAEETLIKAKKLFKKVQYEDEGIYEHLQELLEECKTFEYKPGEEGPDPDDDEDGDSMEDDGDEEWEDLDDDEEVDGDDVEMEE